MMYEMDDYWQPLSYIIQAGADMWNKNLTNIGFNNEQGVEGLTFFDQLYHEDQVVLPLEKYTNKDEERSYFYNGQVAMFPQQIHYTNIIKEASDINLGAFALPAGPASDEEQPNGILPTLVCCPSPARQNILMKRGNSLSISPDRKLKRYICQKWDFSPRSWLPMT